MLIEKTTNKSFVVRDGYAGTKQTNSLGMAARFMMGTPEGKLTLIRTDNAKFNSNLSKVVKSSNRIVNKLANIKRAKELK